MAASAKCPECGAGLKFKADVPAGKKVKCPKCEAVFAVTESPAPPAKKKAAPKDEPKPAPVPAAADDEDDDTNIKGYGVLAKEETEEEKAFKKKGVPIGGVENRFKKSARGPAMVKVVKPSTVLLVSGMIQTGLCIFFIIRHIFPLVFESPDFARAAQAAKEDAEAEAYYKQNQGKPGVELPKKKADGEKKVLPNSHHYMWIGIYAGFLVLGGLICMGAGMMQNLEAYPLAWVGVVSQYLCAIPVGIWAWLCMNEQISFFFEMDGTYPAIPAGLLFAAEGFYAATRAAICLADEEVKAGFYDKSLL